MFTTKNPLRVGTDCSGIEAPIMALQMASIPFSHEFSSDIDHHCIASIQANYNPKIIFRDMRNRKLEDIPNIDLYVCGFPCQPFSVAGDRGGVLDPRGTIFWECLRVIKYKKPIFFVLENVKGLLSITNGETFKIMLRELEALKIYNVYWKVMNTADYGIPQSRKRVFIVGIRKNLQKKQFEWPLPIECNNLKDYVDWDDKQYHQLPPSRKNIFKTIIKDALYVDLGFYSGSRKMSKYLCPCLNTSPNLWCVPMHRYANIKEYLTLQGFPLYFNQVVSDSKLKKQVGNSMSINVLIFLFKSIFQTY